MRKISYFIYLCLSVQATILGNSYFLFEIEVLNQELTTELFEVHRGEILSPPTESNLSYQAVAVCSIESSTAEYSFDENSNVWQFTLPSQSTTKIVLKTICLNKGYSSPPQTGVIATDLKIIDDFDYLDKVCTDAHRVIAREGSKDIFNVFGTGEASSQDYDERCVSSFLMAVYNLLENVELVSGAAQIVGIYYNSFDSDKLNSLPGACELRFDDEVRVVFEGGQEVSLIDFRNGNGETDYDYPNKIVFTILCDVSFIK